MRDEFEQCRFELFLAAEDHIHFLEVGGKAVAMKLRSAGQCAADVPGVSGAANGPVHDVQRVGNRIQHHARTAEDAGALADGAGERWPCRRPCRAGVPPSLRTTCFRALWEKFNHVGRLARRARQIANLRAIHPQQRPFIHHLRAEFAVKSERFLVPAQGDPFETTAGLHGGLGDPLQQGAANAALAEQRADVKVVKKDSRPAHESREGPEKQGIPAGSSPTRASNAAAAGRGPKSASRKESAVTSNSCVRRSNSASSRIRSRSGTTSDSTAGLMVNDFIAFYWMSSKNSSGHSRSWWSSRASFIFSMSRSAPL